MSAVIPSTSAHAAPRRQLTLTLTRWSATRRVALLWSVTMTDSRHSQDKVFAWCGLACLCDCIITICISWSLYEARSGFSRSNQVRSLAHLAREALT